ncbi:MAG: pilus assembly protein [Anaerolineales bacterium]|nr:pilus assembly protein [Anaerolineales bacterium]
MKTMKKECTPKQKRGQSLVEMAISLTVILWLLAGAVDLGSALFAWIALRDAAEEGALFGSVYPTLDDGDGIYEGEAVNTAAIRQRVCATATNPIKLTGSDNLNCNVTLVTVNVTTSTPPCAGGWVRVDVVYNYSIMMPLTGTIIGTQTIPIRASATNTLLRPACP